MVIYGWPGGPDARIRNTSGMANLLTGGAGFSSGCERLPCRHPEPCEGPKRLANARPLPWVLRTAQDDGERGTIDYAVLNTKICPFSVPTARRLSSWRQANFVAAEGMVTSATIGFLRVGAQSVNSPLAAPAASSP